LSGVYALFPDEPQTVEAEGGWSDKWPQSDEAGVYLVFGGSGRLLYIGKASMNQSIGNRLSFYFGSDRVDKTCTIVHEGRWKERPMYIATVAVPREMRFEAPALEEYLIASLGPCDNANGANCL
jgi:excinuclease UvrABC nuclease subunit